MPAHKKRDPTEKAIECAATSFLRVEKGRKETPGALPPGPQEIGRFSFPGKPALPFFLESAFNNKGARGPGDRLGAGLKKYSNPNPWGRSPFLYRPVRVAASESIFIERKSTKPPGGSGGKAPDGSFPPFLSPRKGVARRPNQKKRVWRVVRAKRTRFY